MKVSQLKDIIREIINEQIDAMDEDSQAAKDAKVQGLTNLGFGRWGKEGPDGKMTVTNISDKGKLVPFSKAAMQRKTGMTFGRGKNANTMYTPSGYGKAQMTEPGKVQRRTPRETPDQQRAANAPTDSLGHASGEYMSEPGSPITAQKIVSKINDKLYDRDPDLLTPHFNQDMSMDDFSKLTGLNPTQISAYDRYADKYDRSFSIDTDRNGTKSVYVHSPEDL
jgi:hypothetical protein